MRRIHLQDMPKTGIYSSERQGSLQYFPGSSSILHSKESKCFLQTDSGFAHFQETSNVRLQTNRKHNSDSVLQFGRRCNGEAV